MTAHGNQQASLIARYEDAKATACLLGFQLTVTRRAHAGFVLSENGETVDSFADIAHVEHFLRGVQIEKDAKAKARLRSRR
jgi:hypothetical protein